MVTLTTAGRTYTPPLVQEATVAEWGQSLSRLLDLGIEMGRLRDRSNMMERWLDANPWHELHGRRHGEWRGTLQRLCEVDRAAYALSVAMTSMQSRMNAAAIAEIERRIGHELRTTTAMQMCFAASHAGSHRLQEVLTAWDMGEPPF